MTRWQILLLLALGTLLTSCGSVTEIEGSWTSPKYSQAPMSKVVVFVVGAQSFIAEATVESEVAKGFNARGVTSTAASDMFQPSQYDQDQDGKVDDPNFRETALAKLNELGFDAILIISVKDVTKEERYVPGTVTYQPRSYYTGGWYDTWNRGYGYGYGGYWNRGYERIETPGYTATDVNAYLETNLYSLSDDGLAWAAQTNTINPQTLQDAAESFADKIVPAIIKSGVLRTSEQ